MSRRKFGSRKSSGPLRVRIRVRIPFPTLCGLVALLGLLATRSCAATPTPTPTPESTPASQTPWPPPPPPPPAPLEPPTPAEAEASCPLSLSLGDPTCANGGLLKVVKDWAKAQEEGNCASCFCPGGWGGVECRQCVSSDVCTAEGERCDTHQLLPPPPGTVGGPGATQEDYVHQISCSCGSSTGDSDVDYQTNEICKLQPGTTMTLDILPEDEGSSSGSILAVERAGVKTQDDSVQSGRYSYAAAAVWDGNFTKCRWGIKECEPPLMGQCWFYTCEQTSNDPASISCPASSVEECPGMQWDTDNNCGQVPGETYNYYQHHCMHVSVPDASSETTLQCPTKPLEDGSFQCFLMPRANPFLRFIGLKCRVGACVHPSAGPPVPPPPPPPPPPFIPQIPHSLYEPLSLVLLGLLVAASITGAGLLVRGDMKRLHAKALSWQRLHRLPAPSGALPGESITSPLLWRGAETGMDGGIVDNSGDGEDDELSDVEHEFSPEEFSPRVFEPAVVSWEGISYTVYTATLKRKVILRSVCGLCGTANPLGGPSRSGCLMAVLGPSGAGKTSLMDCLAGRREGPGVKGEVRLNGHLMDARSMRRAAGYVQQEDVLPGTATVWEYLWFIASLRLPAELTEAQKESRVMSLIHQLGLEKVAHSFIGDSFVRGLSGGEKRRVSIAAELITRPAVIFLDEATTGLDSTNAARVVDILADLAREGVGVVLTIHQPRSDLLALLDRVLLMSGTGQVVYSGPISRALQFFSDNGFRHQGEAINPADWMLDVVIKSEPGIVATLVDAYEASRVAADDADWMAQLATLPGLLPPPRFEASFKNQFRCLSTRLVRNSYRHPFLISLNLLASLAMAVAVALVFYQTGTSKGGVQNRLGVLFFLLLFLSLMSLSSLPIWNEARLLFRRERDASTYGTSAYFAAVYMFDILPLRVLPPCFFGLISYSLIGLHPGCAGCIWWFVTVLMLANIASATCSMAIGAGTSSNATGNLVGSLFIMLSMVFGGLMLNKDQVPWWASWMEFSSLFNYAYEALAVNEFSYTPLMFDIDLDVAASTLPSLQVKGESVLSVLGFSAARFAADIAMLIFILAFSAGLTYLLLVVGDTRKGGARTVMATLVSQLRAVLIPRPVGGAERPLSMTRLTTLPAMAGLAAIEEEPSMEERSLEALAAEAQDDEQELEETVQAELGSDGELDLAPPPSLLRSALLTDTEAAQASDPMVSGPDHAGGLQFGSHQLRAAATREPGVCLSWENVRCIVQVRGGAMGATQRLVLNGVSGIAGATSPTTQGSSCAALMGPSGAGKTTLLDILAGRRNDGGVFGEVRFNGRPTPPAMRMKMSGYVMQDDVLPGASSVLEYMMFHAKLRLPAGMLRSQRVERVMNIIKELTLGKVAHTYIGDAFLRGLSGGEKRRVSIAAELLTRPGVLFLDEPTTGLDSTNAANVVDLLARLAEGGVTVMMSLHQPRPDIFRLLERVTLLSKDGCVVYSGLMGPSESFFQRLGYSSPSPNIHVVDFMLDVVIKGTNQEVQRLVNVFESSEVREQDVNVMVQMHYNDAMTSIHSARTTWLIKYEASPMTQLKVLAARQLRNAIRHPMLITLNLGATVFVACLLGSIYYQTGTDSTGALQNRFGALFFILLFQTLMSLSSLPVWEQDRLLFLRERASGAYSTGPYFWSVVFFDLLPLRCVPPLLFVVITYGLIGLHSTAMAVVRFWVVLVMANVAGATVNMAIGASLDSSAVANAVGSIYCLLSILLSGFLRANEGMPSILQYISQLSFVSHAFEALMINEFGYGADGFRFTLHIAGSTADPSKEAGFDVTGDEVLHTFGFPHNVTFTGHGCMSSGDTLPYSCVFIKDLARLILLISVHLLVTYLMLKYRVAS